MANLPVGAAARDRNALARTSQATDDAIRLQASLREPEPVVVTAAALVAATRRFTTATGAATVTVTTNDGHVSVDAAAVAATVVMPDPTTCVGRLFVVKKWNTTAVDVTISATIDGTAGYTLTGTTRPVARLMATTTGYELV